MAEFIENIPWPLFIPLCYIFGNILMIYLIIKKEHVFPEKAGLIIMATGFLAAAIHEIPIKIAFPFVIDILLETLSVLRLFGPLIYFGGLIKKIDDPVAKRTGKVAYITLCSGVCLLFLIFIIIAHFKK
jgi:hypothetical protein